MKINKSVLQRALKAWGFMAQINMVREECLELSLAIGKFYERGRTSKKFDKIIDEMADVHIMLEQMYIDPEIQSMVQSRIDVKIKRLDSRIKMKEQLKQ